MRCTTIVIPCYNEAQRLDQTRLVEFARQHSEVRLLLVNDGSRDATLHLLHQMAAACPQQISVLNLPHNQGKAEAVRLGMLQALETGSQLVGFLDADLAAPAETCLQLAEVLRRREDCQMAFASRLALMGRQIQRKATRRLLGRVFAFTASTLLGTAIRDTQCGAKMFRNVPTVRRLFATRFASRWIFDCELIARHLANRAATDPHNSGIYEMPLDQWREVPGSKLRSGDFFRALGELASIVWHYRRGDYLWEVEPEALIPLTRQPTDDSTTRRAA